MTRVTCSPGKYVQGSGVLSELGRYAAALGRKGAYAVLTPFAYDHCAGGVEKSFADAGLALRTHRFGGECCQQEIDGIVQAVRGAGSDVVIGMGGGKALDTAKAVGYYAALPVVIVPTAASSDAPCSALSVLYTPDGRFERYLFLRRNPDLVLVDTAVVAAAPVRLLVAGMGDALATFYEARACRAAHGSTCAGGVCSLTALHIAEACRDTLFRDGFKAKTAVECGTVSEAVENVVEANTYLSGVGFESGGLAAAHAVHNGLTVLAQTHDMLHGEKVAFGTLVQLALENAPLEEFEQALAFCRRLGLPTSLAMLGAAQPDRESLMAVAEAACAPGDTMGNLPFPVTPADVYSAILVADRLGR